MIDRTPLLTRLYQYIASVHGEAYFAIGCGTFAVIATILILIALARGARLVSEDAERAEMAGEI